jgi:DNA-binding LacI/PurR family transcriptional regulator
MPAHPGLREMAEDRLTAPPLTTVGLDMRQAGRGRAEMIMASLAGRESVLGAAREEWKVIQRSSA